MAPMKRTKMMSCVSLIVVVCHGVGSSFSVSPWYREADPSSRPAVSSVT